MYSWRPANVTTLTLDVGRRIRTTTRLPGVPSVIFGLEAFHGRRTRRPLHECPPTIIAAASSWPASAMLSAFTARPIIELRQRDRSKIETILAYGMTSVCQMINEFRLVKPKAPTWGADQRPQATAFSLASTVVPSASIASMSFPRRKTIPLRPPKNQISRPPAPLAAGTKFRRMHLGSRRTCCVKSTNSPHAP